MIEHIGHFMDRHPAAGACILVIALFAMIGAIELALTLIGYGDTLPN